MAENRINPLPEEGKNVEKQENKENGNGERFESDTHKVVRQHLEDPDHVITDEDIANIRVGMVPPLIIAASEENREETEEKFIDDAGETKEDKNLDDEQITPWDTIDPS